MKLKELIQTQVGFLKINDIFYCEGNIYKILSLGNRDINNVCCKNLKTNKIKWFDTTSDVEVFNE